MAKPDRELRRMVAQLQAFPVDDFDSVMDDLAPEKRQRVAQLLREFEDADLDHAFVSSNKRSFQPKTVPPDLSPWLIARINEGHKEAKVISMTPHASFELRACAAELAPKPKHSAPTISLLSRLGDLFRRPQGVR